MSEVNKDTKTAELYLKDDFKFLSKKVDEIIGTNKEFDINIYKYRKYFPKTAFYNFKKRVIGPKNKSKIIDNDVWEAYEEIKNIIKNPNNLIKKSIDVENIINKIDEFDKSIFKRINIVSGSNFQSFYKLNDSKMLHLIYKLGFYNIDHIIVLNKDEMPTNPGVNKLFKDDKFLNPHEKFNKDNLDKPYDLIIESIYNLLGCFTRMDRGMINHFQKLMKLEFVDIFGNNLLIDDIEGKNVIFICMDFINEYREKVLKLKTIDQFKDFFKCNEIINNDSIAYNNHVKFSDGNISNDKIILNISTIKSFFRSKRFLLLQVLSHEIGHAAFDIVNSNKMFFEIENYISERQANFYSSLFFLELFNYDIRPSNYYIKLSNEYFNILYLVNHKIGYPYDNPYLISDLLDFNNNLDNSALINEGNYQTTILIEGEEK